MIHRKLVSCLILACLILVIVTGCGQIALFSADRAFASGDYQKAADKYAEASENGADVGNKLESSRYELGKKAIRDDRLDEAVAMLRDNGYEDAQNILVDAFDSQLRTAADIEETMRSDISLYADVPAFEQAVRQYVNALYRGSQYAEYVRGDMIVSALSDGIPLKAELISSREQTMQERVLAYLPGLWQRQDGTDLDGVIGEILVSDGVISCILRDVSQGKNAYGFEVNDLKWTDGHMLNSTEFNINDLTKYEPGSGIAPEYGVATGKVDLNTNTITVNVVAKGDEPASAGYKQTWVRI